MEQNRPGLKVVLLGDSGVGKTSLLGRWTTGIFNKTVKSTVGANHQRKRVDIGEQEVDLVIWDTAGQEQFQALTPLYARASTAAIIVACVNDKSSIDAIPHWVELLASSCEKMPPIVLAFNKIDATTEQFDQDKLTNKCGCDPAGVFFVSALSGEGVDNLFNCTASASYKFSTISAQPQTLTPTQNTEKKDCC